LFKSQQHPHNTLHDLVEDTAPRGVGRDLGAVGVDGIPVELTTAGVDIHLVGAEPTGALPGETNDPEDDDAEQGKLALEEALDSVETGLANRSSNGGVELDIKLATG
jgi:hypothetical protein